MAKLDGVITQNIDGLHQKAGSRHTDHRPGTCEGSIQRTSSESGRDVRLKVFFRGNERAWRDRTLFPGSPDVLRTAYRTIS